MTLGITRVADTVRRPVRPFTATIQAYLAHLRQAGFSDAPKPLGIDEQGREVLSFVEGDVLREPLSPEATGEDVLAALAGLIRRLHDAAQRWTPPRDAVWATLPGTEAIPLVDTGAELVGHRDYCPGNVVFRNGLPAALIDFDLARPTTRVYDIANAYGMSDQQRRDLVPLARRMVHRFHLTSRAAAEADPVFRCFWEQGVKNRMPRAESWLAQEGTAIAARLTQRSGC
ncbi:aminoglycoside phosphotransferase family protein [Actinomadura sp. RB99]|uniref:aminoglycoside phosphotransferase family protein n=1 Tax=Actinomadura sp. RB99 TaxID=2691577 RepID=UPI00321FB3D7